MRLAPPEAMAKLHAADHGVLSTLHPERGIDSVPAVYAVDGEDGDAFVGIPIDTVKPKSSTRLQRVRNLEADPRATLLIDHWDHEDWTQLWWVRAELRWEPSSSAAFEAALAQRLADRFPQYRKQPFARVLVFRLHAIAGWSALAE